MVKTAKAAGQHADSIKLHEYLAIQIEATMRAGKTQRQIAEEMGYDKPNILSMMKTGSAKVPLEKIPALARALNVDGAHLFRLALQQYWPGDYKAIAEVFGTVCTKNEAKIIEVIREATRGTDPDVTPDLVRRIRAAVKG